MNQKAYRGDLIKVTKAFDEPYSIGDIFEVDYRGNELGENNDCIFTTEGFLLKDDEYKLFKVAEKFIQSITDKQIEKINQMYKRACNLQLSSPYEYYDATEIQTILSICNILEIKLDK